MTNEESNGTNYLKIAAVGAVGIGVGAAGYAVTLDTPTTQTTEYQNLQDNLTDAQNNNADLEDQVADLQTTVTDKEDRVTNLEDQVTQFNNTVEELRAENADLEDAVATAQERVGLVDYLPVFSDADVEFQGAGLNVEIEESADADEGDYDRITANYSDEDGGEYDVEITQYEESEDADDAVEDFRETANPVEFSEDGDTHTVEVSGYEGDLQMMAFDYSDADAIEDVDHEDDVESVYVDGEDVTDRVESVSHHTDTQLRIDFENGYYVNDGETVKVTYSDATSDGDFETAYITDEDGQNFNNYEYDQDSDNREDVYRDGNTVVEVTGERNGDSFDAQYADLTSQYE